AKWLYFYDFVNNDFTEFHPNLVTAENVERVGCHDGPDTPCENVSSFDRSYGPGEPPGTRRSDGAILRQIGTDLQLFDLYFYGALPLPLLEDKQLTFKVGRQTINWGESTALVINSLNQVNAVNANNLTRTGFDLSELYVPSGMLTLSTELFEATTIEAFYGYEWEPLEIPAPGSFYSFADAGTNNTVGVASISFGGPAEDPDRVAAPLNNPLSGLTNTTTSILRRPDNEARDSGQYGFTVKYFAEWLNNGTELAFYFMNYHSKLPYVSFYAADESCARQGADHSQDGGEDINATNGIELLLACPDLPLVHQPDHVDARTATSNAVPIDTVQFQFEYPEDLKLYGISFNTTMGDFSIQGEVAYRPDSPLQVDLQDLTFHA
ncbi:MAG: DUF1302 family protein, partial [Hydrocarboniphaga effusa]|nr:DUF1302 family protein [Hydrocarboniphaga effusa]